MANIEVNGGYLPLVGNDVSVSHPVSAGDLGLMAQNANYLLGKGAQLIPVSAFGREDNQVTNVQSIEYEVAIFPRPQTLERVWRFEMSGSRTNDTSDLSFVRFYLAVNAGTTQLGWPGNPIEYVESVYTVPQEIEIVGITASMDDVGKTDVNGLVANGAPTTFSCMELPRTHLDITSSTDFAVDTSGLSALTPIVDYGSDRTGIRGLCVAVSSAIGHSRKAGSWFYVAPWKRNGQLINSNGTNTLGVLQATTTRAYFSDVSQSIHGRRVYPESEQPTCTLDVAILGVSSDVASNLVLEFETEVGTYELGTTLYGSGAPVRWTYGQIEIPTEGTFSSGSATPATGPAKFNFSYYTTVGGTTGSIYAVCIGEAFNKTGL